MIILECEQYSDEWWAGRLGIPTTSMFSKMVSSEGKKSVSWKEVLNKLVAEKLRGKADEGFKSKWMERGHEFEPMGSSLYSLLKGVELKSVGLVYRDEKKDCGFSPDRLMENGGLEIKCPSAGVHVGYLRDNKIPSTYKPQVFGSLYLSGLDFWDFMSFHPDLAPLIIRVDTTDKGYIKYKDALDIYLPMFISELNETFNLLTTKE